MISWRKPIREWGKKQFAIMAVRSGLAGLHARLRSPSIVAVNYHEVSADQLNQLQQHFAYYADHFEVIREENFQAGSAGTRPRLIISFDDGWDCHSRLVAPLLGRYGLVGWFFLPVGYIEEPTADFVRQDPRSKYLEPMTWEDARKLSEQHVVAGHTYTHATLGASRSSSFLERELIFSKELLERRLSKPIKSFAWVRGLTGDFSVSSAQMLTDAGYERSFFADRGDVEWASSTIHIPRLNIEARHSLDYVKLQLSGLIEHVVMPRHEVRQMLRMAG